MGSSPKRKSDWKAALRPSAFLVFISLMNLLFFMTAHKNISYQYILESSWIYLRLILLKLSFGGFSLGLLVGGYALRKLSVRLPSKAALLRVLAYSGIAIFIIINYFVIPDGILRYGAIFFLIAAPAFAYGLLYSRALEESETPLHISLFLLVIGSAIAAAIYNLVLVYFPFIFAYAGFFVALIVAAELSASRGLWRIGAIAIQCGAAIAAVAMLSAVPNYGQVYNSPWFLTPGASLNTTVFGPSGILDVINDSKTLFLLSDKLSPSEIAVKGNPTSELTKIPYHIRPYNTSLLIAVGGGNDIAAGLYYDTSNITAVDIDSGRIALMEGKFSAYSNGLFSDPRVRVVVQGGREFMRHDNSTYDLIVVHSPWTQKVTNSFFYDPSLELFTTEAFSSYMNALNDKGILYFGVEDVGHMENYFSPLKDRLAEIKGNMVILLPGHEPYPAVVVIISKGFPLDRFYSEYKNRYEFVYVPGQEPVRGRSAVVDYLFFGEGSDGKVRTDRQLYGVFDRSALGWWLTLAVAAALLLVIAAAALKRPQTAAYVLLGSGYELVLVFFAVWLSLFFSNFLVMMPVVICAFFALGGIGYLISGRLDRKQAASVALAIGAALAILLIAESQMGEGFPKYLALAAFIAIGCVITIPFGYLVRKEGAAEGALAADYLGSLLSIIVVFGLPNLDYLLAFSVFSYLLVGAIVFFNGSKARTGKR